MFFERLSEEFQNLTGKFWELVEKQNPLVGHTDFAWLRGAATAHHAGVGDRVMGRSEGSLSGKMMGLTWRLTEAMDFVAFEGFVGGEWWEDVGEAAHE